MASAFENRLRRTIEMAGTDGQAGPVPVMATPSVKGVASTLGGMKIRQVSPRLAAAIRPLVIGKAPLDVVLFGDSTGDEPTEWYGKLGDYLATGVGSDHSVAYKLWSDTNQQYSTGASARYVSVGPLGRRYVAFGAAVTSHRIELDDSAQTSVTGDLQVSVLVNLAGGTFASQWALCGKFGLAGSRSWRMEIMTDNRIFFEHSADGTAQINRTSIALSGSQLTDDIWLRVRLDVDNGASGNTAKFYTSADYVTWTQLGTDDVKAGVTSVFDTATTMQFIGRGGQSVTSIGKDVKFFEARVHGAFDESALAAWVDAGSIQPRTSATSIAYRDDLGNPGTITYQGSSVGGSPRLCLFNGSVGGQVIAYGSNATRFAKMAAGQLDVAFISYSHNEGADVAYRADYKALTDLILARNPDAAIVGVIQNRRYAPATYIEEHEVRLQQISTFCASQGFDTLDFFGLVTQADMKADGVHPEPTLAGDKMGAAAYFLVQLAGGLWNAPA